MGKVLRNILLCGLLAIVVLLASFEFEPMSGNLLGPGERITRFYRSRERNRVAKTLQEARTSTDKNADLEILRMLDNGVIEGRNIGVAVFVLGEKRSRRSVERIIRIMQESFRAEGDPLVFQACAEALGKIGGKEALDTLQFYYDISTRPDHSNYWRAKVLDADRVLKDAIKNIGSPNKAL